MQTTSIVLLLVALLESGRGATGARHVKPISPVPMEFQVDCGENKTCDGRTQFCATEAMPSCEDCAIDMCAFTEHKDYDATMYQCEEHCPVFAEKLAAEKYCGTCAGRCSIPSTIITTTTSSETTSSYDCAEEIAIKDHKINSLQSKLASKDVAFIWLASYAGIVTVGLLAVIVVILCGHRLKATFCSAKNPPKADPANCEKGLLKYNELKAHVNDVVDDGSSNGENGNQPPEDEIGGAGGVDRDNGTVPKFPGQTAQPERP